ncbi:Putative transmembrane protein (Alph_Pro_TM) [Desulfonauticus submarinus]|uniref:Putative transmembrane protein (Alph_Pro_TM) n=1 Tax=Desulfonauticus submarinus TaxID=206665 RepID=A0A1H0CGJ7_9BACT|nr:TIGR02186 family protein [Desulfonauticus submarinus]SDN56972.1 Putative transmembrane protein (Alph_Pro_TM) [Desulfonauticus submarinus]
MLRFRFNIILVLSLFIFNFYSIAAHAFLHNPREININTTFNGAKLYVSGEVNSNNNVVVEVLGSDKEEKFKQKGKVWGIFWMTVGHYAFKGVPSIYLMYLPKSLSHLSQEKFDELNLGYKEVYSRLEINPIPKDKKSLFNEFLKLKQRDKLYGIYQDQVTYSNITAEKKKYHVEVHLPSRIVPGVYTIKVYEVTPDLKIVKTESDNFQIKLTGFPAFISNMAFNHSLIYGILSVIIAIFAGIFMGFLFKDKGGAH